MSDKPKKQPRPGVGGAIEDLVDSVKDAMGVGKSDSMGNANERSAMSDLDSNTSSNAGRQAQSTDSSNKY